MKQTTSEEIAAFHGSEQKYMELIFSDGTTITTEDIVSESLEVAQSLSDGDQFNYCAGGAAAVKVSVFATLKRYTGLRMTVKVTAGEFTRSFGTFNIKSDTISSDGEYRELVGYDDLSEILQRDFSDWHNNLTFPLTIKQYRDSFATAAGVTQQSITLPNDDVKIEHNFVANGYSGKDALDAICEINACFAIINTDGYLQYIQPATADDGLYPSPDLYPSPTLYPMSWGNPMSGAEYDLGSLHYEEYTMDPITGVQIRQTENDVGASVGTSENVYIIEDNPLLYGKTTAELQAAAQAFLNRAHGVTFTPAGMTAQASPWFELGDAITVDTKMERITTIIMSKTTSGIVALVDTYDAQATKKREENTNSTSRNLEILKRYSHELTVTQEQLSSRIEEVDADLTGKTTALSTRIDQTSEAITLEASRAKAAEAGVTADYTGTVAPTKTNAPASGWTTDAARAQHIGEVYLDTKTGKYYAWECEGLVVNFSDRCITESGFDYVYVLYQDGSTYRETAALTGGKGGTTNNIAGKKIFVPTSTVYVYWYTDGSATDWGFKIDSITKTTGAPEMPNSVSTLPASVTDVISGVTNLPETSHPYTDSTVKLWQINTGLSVAGFRWKEVGSSTADVIRSLIQQTADEITLEVTDTQRGLSTSIKQTAESIDLSGYVRFTNLSTSGETSINGGNIKTGTISSTNGNMTINMDSGQITASNFSLSTTSLQMNSYGVFRSGPADSAINTYENTYIQNGMITNKHIEPSVTTHVNDRYTELAYGYLAFYSGYKNNTYQSKIKPREYSNSSTKNLEIVTNILYVNKTEGGTGDCSIRCGSITSSGDISASGSLSSGGNISMNGAMYGVVEVLGNGSNDLTINANGRKLNLHGVYRGLNINGENAYSGWFTDATGSGNGVRHKGGYCDMRWENGILVEISPW